MKKIDSILVFCAWSYLAITLAALALMYLTADRWWPGTLLLFGPRWMLALPLIPLLPLALWRRAKLTLPLILGAVIVFGPIMGLRWSYSPSTTEEGQQLRILTCNIGGKDFDPQKLSNLILDYEVDIVTLQECPQDLELSLPEPWERYKPSSLAIYSKFSIVKETIQGLTKNVHPQNRVLSCSINIKSFNLTIYSIHLPTMRYGLQHIADRRTGINIKKMKYLNEQKERITEISKSISELLKSQNDTLIIGSDLNMPIESNIYKTNFNFLKNAFSTQGMGYGWTTSPETLFVPIPIRIDHILTHKDIKILSSKVLPDVGSDHLPVMAEILLQ